VLVQAQADFAAAVATESPRLRLDILVPGLNEQIESRFPFDSAMLTEVTLRLADAIAPLRVRHLPALLSWHARSRASIPLRSLMVTLCSFF
jgi:hypothetical protein